ncbi:hypothetical protein [Nitrospira defluvii]|uniref:Uncharacterized protein n=1 Tax=Nitrospira defluvii TaxID=330214 RepID=A0ABM8RJH0_9BACT|nr:hypothetical protein [Nitrospira defluvii]CAE6756360.1 hypothetical protein NSPZN2_30423 [Nitrospira defluvii]
MLGCAGDEGGTDSILIQEEQQHWWYWSNLAPDPWLVGVWVPDVVEVRISGAQAAKGPYFIGAFSILD